MVLRRAFVLGVSAWSVGCGALPYAHATIDYAANPELRNVRLYTGRADLVGENLVTVEVYKEARGDCSNLAATALKELLSQAVAVGGEGVKEVRFRARWNWAGRLVCRRVIAGKSVRVRGIAEPRVDFADRLRVVDDVFFRDLELGGVELEANPILLQLL